MYIFTFGELILLTIVGGCVSLGFCVLLLGPK
jgi:hypothetical protein